MSAGSPSLTSLAGLTALLLLACEGEPTAGEGDARPSPVTTETAEAAVAPPPSEAPADDAMIGVLVPEAEVVLTAAGFARLERLDHQLGDLVAAGELVATLDVPGDRSELAAARAAWKAARAELDRLELELEQARASRSDVEQLEDFVSRAELRERRFAEQLAAARKRSAGASLSQQRIEIEAASERVAEAELRAPFDAVVGQRYAGPGATLGLGEPVVELISQARLVRFAVPEDRIDACSIGARVHVRFPEAELELGGKVSAVAPEIDAGTRLLFVEAELDEQPPLRIGTVARVSC